MKPFYLLLFSLVTAFAVRAEHDENAMGAEQSLPPATQLSLSEVTRSVLTNNPSIKSARAKWAMMKERIPQARAWDDPMAGADFERMGTTRLNTFSDIEYMVSQTLPLTGKNLSRARAANAEALSVFEELRRTELDKVKAARVAYYRLSNAWQQLEINRRNLVLLRDFADISRSRYQVGTQTQGDVLLAETDLARLMEARVDILREVSDQQSALNVLMNRPARSPLGKPAALSFTPMNLSAERIEALALENRPELAMAGKKIDAEKARLQLARRQWIPDPQVRVEARQYNGQPGIREYDTGVFFNVPWVNFSKYSAGVREAQQSVEMTSRDYDATHADTLGLVRDQLKKVMTFAHHYELFRDKILPLAEQSVQTGRTGYESAKSDFLSLITARRTLQDVESMFWSHLTEHEIAVAELEALVGTDLRRASRLSTTTREDISK